MDKRKKALLHQGSCAVDQQQDAMKNINREIEPTWPRDVPGLEPLSPFKNRTVPSPTTLPRAS